MPVNEQFLQELKNKIDITDIVSSYVSLKKRGSTYVGLCPFHNEKTPSFTVYPQTQSFYCFGCSAGGDMITFLKKIENLDYVDAVKLLAQRAGLQMPADGFDDSMAKRRRRIYEANRAAAKYFHSVLMSSDGSVALEYYRNRKFTLHTIKKFGLGYAPNSWDSLLKHLKSLGFTVSEMQDAGLVIKGQKGNYYDCFRNRVMTPIIDVRGNVIAFGGRVLDDSKPKYVNTNDTLVYKKSNEVFGLNFAKDSGKSEIILCEGYMDVIAMNQAGFTNCVAGCGTALNSEQVNLISRYAKSVILAYDNDEAGQTALLRALNLFKNADIKIRIPLFDYGKDPDEIIKNVGVDKFGAMLENAINETEFKILRQRKNYNISTTQGKIDFISAIVPVLAEAEPVERSLYTGRLAEELHVDKNAIDAQINEYLHRSSRKQRFKERNAPVLNTIRDNQKIARATGESSKMVKAVDRIIFLLVKYPDCIKLCGDLQLGELPDGFYRKVFEITVNNIKSGYDNDLINFSSLLSDDELSRLSGILAIGRQSADPKKEFADCIKLVREENAKKNKKSAADMTDDEFRRMFNT